LGPPAGDYQVRVLATTTIVLVLLAALGVGH
jgi:hypothetical protein